MMRARPCSVCPRVVQRAAMCAACRDSLARVLARVYVRGATPEQIERARLHAAVAWAARRTRAFDAGELRERPRSPEVPSTQLRLCD